jgi:hypothetical protein
MEILQLKQAFLALAVIAIPVRPLVAQNEPELQDSGLTFTIRNATLAHEGTLIVFRAILDNRTKQDWYMRSATIMVNATCGKGLRLLNVNVHATGSSIKPGPNYIAESVRADQTCKFDSLGPVRFKALRPVDDSTQEALDADRGLRRALDELNALQPEREKLRKDAIDRQRAFCHEVYATTATKKVSDLTVVEAQDVRTCQEADYYK